MTLDVRLRRVGAVLHDVGRRLTAASIEDGRLEADLLLAYALGVDRAGLLARLEDVIEPGSLARFAALVDRRLRYEPLAYITGRREFYGICFECSPGALIPRPETEMLVEFALDEIRRRSGSARVSDVGTGSGAMAIAIAANAPGARVIAVDQSSAALAIARANAERVGVAGRIEFGLGDLTNAACGLDLVVANLPYVSAAEWAELPPEIRDHEPREALVGGTTGTEMIERLLATAAAAMNADGALALEIGAEQGATVLDRARREFPFAGIRVEKDLARHDRMLVVRLNGG